MDLRMIFVKIGARYLRVDLIESIDDQYVITQNGTPYALGDDQTATTVLADLDRKLRHAAQTSGRTAWPPEVPR